MDKAFTVSCVLFPQQLRDENLRFVRLDPGASKSLSTKDWTNPAKAGNYKYAELWLESGNNYGILCGVDGVIIIDDDDHENNTVSKALDTAIDDGIIPATFTVRSGGGGQHRYYRCREIKKKLALYSPETKKKIGEILTSGQQAVGPGCLHRSGNRYEPTNDIPIAEIDAEALFYALRDYVQTNNTQLQAKVDGVIITPATEHDGGGLTVAEVMSVYFPEYSQNKYSLVKHPVHGSTGNGNLSLHPENNYWKCFRCDCGSRGGLRLFAILEKIVPDCTTSLRGKYFKEAVLRAEEKFGVKAPERTAEQKGSEEDTATSSDTDVADTVQTAPQTLSFLRLNSSHKPYKDATNAALVLKNFFPNKIKYNEFARQIEVHDIFRSGKKELEDSDIMKFVFFMQTTGGMPSIAKDIVYSAIQYEAFENKYNEAQDWLNSLNWDGVERLNDWLIRATGCEDNYFTREAPKKWFVCGLVNRMLNPGCIWDYVLVLVGRQNLGKTGLFRLLGGPWYKCYTGSVDNKDFYIEMRGAAILDLDEGATLTRSDVIKMKSIITRTDDEYRAPYDHTSKRYPRQFAFSMSTNDDEPFKDFTGNRRYWPIKMEDDKKVDFKWLEENREQLFAEAVCKLKEGYDMKGFDFEYAQRVQLDFTAEDSFEQDIYDYVSIRQKTTLKDVYLDCICHGKEHPSLDGLNKGVEMRIAGVLKKIGCVKKRLTVNGEREVLWHNEKYKKEENVIF